MKFLIDANCVIYLFAGNHPALSRRVEDTGQGDIGLSTIVLAELLMGVAQGKPPSSEALEVLSRQMPVISFDEDAARAYAQIPFRRGRYDRLLAGHALSLGVSIITANGKDFADVPNLKIEDWTQ